MSLTAALLLLAPIAASGAPGAATGDGGAGVSRPVPVATASATASARIIRPASLRVRRAGDTVEIEAETAEKPQTARDGEGTLWIEFS